MDKQGLTSRKASIGAGFNKMPVLEANFSPCEIKHLQMGSALPGSARGLAGKKIAGTSFTANGATAGATFDKNAAEE